MLNILFAYLSCCIKFNVFTGSIDFLAHYRLVDPKKVDGYAKAFVVEDTDFDTFINFKVLLKTIWMILICTCYGMYTL